MNRGQLDACIKYLTYSCNIAKGHYFGRPVWIGLKRKHFMIFCYFVCLSIFSENTSVASNRHPGYSRYV